MQTSKIFILATVTTVDGKQVNVTIDGTQGNTSQNVPPMNPPPYQSYEQNSYPHPVPPGPGYQQPMGYPPQQPNYPPPGFHASQPVQPGTVIVTNPVVTVQPGERFKLTDIS